MKILHSLGLASVISLASLAANASTLVYDFSGALSISFDPAYQSPEVASEISGIFNDSTRNQKFSGQLILPSFENYLTGTHTVGLNSNGLQMSLTSGFLGGLEGTQAYITRSGATIGSTFVPDATQAGDSGALSIVDGKVAGFSWFAGPTNALVNSFNAHVPAYYGWASRANSINVGLNGSTSSFHIGDVYFASNNAGAASVSMVPEAGSLAMLLSGLGIVGAIVSRRRLPHTIA